MKKEYNEHKGSEKALNILHKVSDTGKKLSANVQKGAKDIYDKAKDSHYKWKIKKYNPVFLEQYNSTEFKLPNMIKIVDDAVRREIDVCDGAIGWRSNENGVEVLYLYDEAIKESKIHFIPAPMCDAIYYVDNFERNRFIKLDTIFEQAHSEKLAELEHIAYSLGAKSCTIEIEEASSEEKYDYNRIEAQETVEYNGVTVSMGESSEKSLQNKSMNLRSGRTVTYFEGNSAPKEPKLKWYQYDDNIKGLIEMRCSGDNSIKSKTLILKGAASSAMSVTTASAVDSAVNKMGNSFSTDMKRRAELENHSKLYFTVEF